MATTAFVRARIDEKVKEEAARVLADEMRVPNALTAKTLAKSERGEDVHFAESTKEFFEHLGI